MRGYLRFLSLHPPLAEPGFRLMPHYAAGLSPASTAPHTPPLDNTLGVNVGGCDAVWFPNPGDPPMVANVGRWGFGCAGRESFGTALF